ncbi:MAG: sugar ABC transporter substrate-binding protein [Christensenellales bacterium]|jgi:ABC-type sugar transport system substrate-binding protein
MRKSISLLLVIVIAVIFIASCTPNSNETEVVYISGVDTLVTPTPQQTTAEPVTRQDISPFFMPGLAEIGIVPGSGHVIGIIASQKYEDQGWWAELCAIRDEYNKKFGVEIKTVLTVTGAQEQIDAAEKMVSEGIDFLILSPDESESSAKVGDLCEQQDIPYITINNSIGKTPGQDGYVCTIEQDDYMIGVLTGISIVKAMIEKHGQPKGHIGEITGVVSDEASMLRSMGMRRVFASFENIKVVCSVAGDYDADTSYKAAVNLLKAYREKELDGIAAVSDDTGLQVLQAVLDLDRAELLGCIWSVGATKSGLTSVWYGDFAQTVECTCQTGMTALEYALQYLEGQSECIPPVVFCMTRVFSAETTEKKDTISAIIAEMDTKGTNICYEDIGVYDLFLPDTKWLNRYYPKHYYEYDDIETYLSEFDPYTTKDTIYNN